MLKDIILIFTFLFYSLLNEQKICFLKFLIKLERTKIISLIQKKLKDEDNESNKLS